MRPTIRKKATVKRKAPQTKPAIDAAREMVKMRHWIQQALAEIKIAREYVSNAWAVPELESIQWAEQFLENALAGKNPKK